MLFIWTKHLQIFGEIPFIKRQSIQTHKMFRRTLFIRKKYNMGMGTVGVDLSFRFLTTTSSSFLDLQLDLSGYDNSWYRGAVPDWVLKISYLYAITQMISPLLTLHQVGAQATPGPQPVLVLVFSILNKKNFNGRHVVRSESRWLRSLWPQPVFVLVFTV